MLDFSHTLYSWWPWLSFYWDVFFLQFMVFYLCFLFFFSTNVFYVLLYLFLLVFFWGIILGLLQADFFTGFLWVVECTVIFVSVILIFYLNIVGQHIFYNIKFNLFFFYWGVLFSFFFFYNFFISGNSENEVAILFNSSVLWFDFYEAINNTNTNDFIALLLSYYSINSLLFLIIGFLLLIASVVCVVLNVEQYLCKFEGFEIFSQVFNIFKEFINFKFIRRQSLSAQAIGIPTLRTFIRK